MGRILRSAVCATVAAAGLLGTAPAQADDASYLATLDANRVFGSGTPDAKLSAGHKFCNELRAGSTPGEIEARTGATLRTFGVASIVDDLRGSLPQVIDIAQHELCPETLGSA